MSEFITHSDDLKWINNVQCLSQQVKNTYVI